MRLLVTLFSIALLGLIAGIVALIVGMQYFSRDLPDYSRLKDYEPPNLTRIHAGDGRLLAEYAAERRVFVPYEAIPPLVKQAFLSAEDKDFFHHAGVDFQSIARAGLTNLKGLGSDKRPIGASTITQQVARNFFLTNEVSYQRKIREMLLSFRLERVLSKERILELYLNQIFLGERSYGVAAAAQNYFDKSLIELSIGQAAYLAALPKAPNNYNPERNKEAAVARRNWIIGRMVEDGYVTPQQAEEAKKEDLVMVRRTSDEVVTAEYFAEEVRRELVAKYGAEAVLEGGLYVRTSLDPRLQAFSDAALRKGIENYDRQRGYRGPLYKNISFADWPKPLKVIAKPAGAEEWELAAVVAASTAQIELITATARGVIGKEDAAWGLRGGKQILNRGDVILVQRKDAKEDKQPFAYALKQVPAVQGALIALDPNTGRVLAMTGGFSPKMSAFNRATQAQRQPGSSFKPFVYMAALDNNFTPSTLVMDAPFEYSQGPGLPLWRPSNYEEGSFNGPTPLRRGMEKSLNLMTVRIANAVGVDKVAEYAEKFGVVDKMPRYLAMSLGAVETTPLRMATAYAMIVNGGKKISPSMIDMVQDRRGKTIWRLNNRLCTACVNLAWSPDMVVPDIPDPRAQIEDPRTAAQMVSILEGVVQRGTAAALKKSLSFPVAGKTGTSNDSKDVWFLGFTPDLVAAVYIGFDDPKSLGAKVTGGSTAAPIFGDFMKNAMQGRPAIPFRVPEGLRFVRVDPVTGHEVEPGTPGAIWEGFKPDTEPSVLHQDVVDGSAPRDPNAPLLEGEVPAEYEGEMLDGTVQPIPAAPAAPSAPVQGTGGLY